MKKIIFIVSFLTIFFIFSAPALAACSWEKLSVTYTYGSIGMPSSSTKTGGCSAKYLSDAADSACSTTAKPTYTTAGGDTAVCCCNGILTTGTEKTALFTPPDLQIAIPGMAKLSTITCDEGGQCEIPWFGQYVIGIYNYAVSIVGILAAIMLMAGGLLWLVSAGDASKITQAKELIIGSVTGMIILAASYIILAQINPKLVNLNTIDLTRIKKIDLGDADVTIIGGTTPYMAGCLAAKKGDLSICQAYGNSEPAGLVTLENSKVNTLIAQKYQAAMECVKQKNGKYLFGINEGWRSAATQIEYKNGGKAAATPCCSNHGSGQALDLKIISGGKMSWSYNESSGLKACMNAQGLYANLNGGSYDEPWHFSPSGR